MFDFVVVDRHKDYTILPKQCSRNSQPRIHHTQPLAMKSSGRAGRGCQPLTSLRTLTATSKVGSKWFGKVVFIDEVITRVVGRVDVDQFDSACVGLLEEFEN